MVLARLKLDVDPAWFTVCFGDTAPILRLVVDAAITYFFDTHLAWMPVRLDEPAFLGIARCAKAY